jgi:hypothetical protein
MTVNHNEIIEILSTDIISILSIILSLQYKSTEFNILGVIIFLLIILNRLKQPRYFTTLAMVHMKILNRYFI